MMPGTSIPSPDSHSPGPETNDDYIQPIRILDLIAQQKASNNFLKVCAPMVRYSKLPFRETCLEFGTDVAYSPMILADTFHLSQIARDCEFTTSHLDKPLIVQFAASNIQDLTAAASLISPYVSGIDLNCGCPQSWACKSSIGASLMNKPELVRDMVSAVKRLPWHSKTTSPIPMSVKIRIVSGDGPHNGYAKTVEYVRGLERAGVDFVTVHGRTRQQKSSEPVDYEAIKTIKQSVSIPIIANGDIFSYKDAETIVERTGVDGVMAARGLLQNPALFDKNRYETTPRETLERFIYKSLSYGSTSFIFHHHVMYMLEMGMSRTEKKSFNTLTSTAGVLDWLEEQYGFDFEQVMSVESQRIDKRFSLLSI